MSQDTKLKVKRQAKERRQWAMRLIKEGAQARGRVPKKYLPTPAKQDVTRPMGEGTKRLLGKSA